MKIEIVNFIFFFFFLPLYSWHYFEYWILFVFNVLMSISWFVKGLLDFKICPAFLLQFSLPTKVLFVIQKINILCQRIYLLWY